MTIPNPQPEAEVRHRDFSGMASNVDPHDLEPGKSQTQTNVEHTRPGVLSIRRGMRKISFEG